MNFDPPSTLPQAFSFHDTRPRRGIAVAVGVSLLLHALLIYGYRQQRPAPAPAPQDKTPVPLTVWLRAPAPAPALRPAPTPPVPLAAATRRPADTRKAPARADEKDRLAAQRAPTVTAPAVALPDSGAVHVAPAADPFAESAPAKPAFDIEAARRVARRIATEKDPARAGTALAQLPDAPIANETRLARDIASAKRGDCKDGVPGGLLAPLFLLMDKKDSGCKW